MKTILEDEKFNVRLEASDWRYSASIVGIMKYFDYWTSLGYKMEYRISHDAIEYNNESIEEKKYLLFVEYYYIEEMHHKVIEQILTKDTLTDEEIRLVNNKLKANSIMKSIFKGIKLSDDGREIILEKINDNRLSIIKETYRNGEKLYANFANKNSLFSPKTNICRILNYYIDIGKKSKSISHSWDFKTYNFEDEIEFDFIPFAFSKSREAFFINNNYSIKQLFHTNNLIAQSDNPRGTLFKDLKHSANFIDFDVEVIIKNRNIRTKDGKTKEKNYFETLYMRKNAIKIFREINNYKAIQINYKMNDNYYINFEKEVTDNILNNIRLDSLIETLLKSEKNYEYNIRELIKINTLIYGGEKMDKQMKSAYKSAKEVTEKIPKNKIGAYRQKLISSIVFKDYDRFCEILLQLSSYSGVVFNFAYDLFKDFGSNKNIAYTFVNALNKNFGENKMMGELSNE